MLYNIHIEPTRKRKVLTVKIESKAKQKQQQQQKSQHITNEHVTFNKETLFHENFPPIKA